MGRKYNNPVNKKMGRNTANQSIKKWVRGQGSGLVRGQGSGVRVVIQQTSQ